MFFCLGSDELMIFLGQRRLAVPIAVAGLTCGLSDDRRDGPGENLATWIVYEPLFRICVQLIPMIFDVHVVQNRLPKSRCKLASVKT